MIVHVWDPYHGDPNNRYQRLGNILTRRVPRQQWRAAACSRPALYGNGIYADLGSRQPLDFRREEGMQDYPTILEAA